MNTYHTITTFIYIACFLSAIMGHVCGWAPFNLVELPSYHRHWPLQGGYCIFILPLVFYHDSVCLSCFTFSNGSVSRPPFNFPFGQGLYRVLPIVHVESTIFYSDVYSTLVKFSNSVHQDHQYIMVYTVWHVTVEMFRCQKCNIQSRGSETCNRKNKKNQSILKKLRSV